MAWLGTACTAYSPAPYSNELGHMPPRASRVSLSFFSESIYNFLRLL